MTHAKSPQSPDSLATSELADRFPAWGLASASALVLWLSFPPVDRGDLAWVALAPLFLIVVSGRSGKSIYLGSWIGGMVFGLLSMSWIASVSVPGMLLMALFMSLWWPVFVLASRTATNRLRVPIWLSAPIVWVAIEYARTLFLSGFPWYYLAHSQYASLNVIQICDLAGAWGLSLVMAMVTALVAEAARVLYHSPTHPAYRPLLIRLGAIAVLIAATLGYGIFRRTSAKFVEGPTLALLQTDFAQELGNGPEPELVYATITRLLAQSVRARPAVDLIVWPETSYPIGVVRIDADLEQAEFAAQVKRLDPQTPPTFWRERGDRSREDIKQMLAATRTPMVLGTTTYDFARDGVRRYNSAVFYQPDGRGDESYHKQALVPFGEYVPFVQSIPWLLALTPYQDGYVPSLTHGPRPRVVRSRGTLYAPVICFEDTLPNLVRKSVLAEAGRPADVVLNLTNDGWFRGSAEHQVHLAISVFRAVECRVPVARAVNTGVTAIIDGNGQVVKSLPQATTGVLVRSVPLDPRSSLYLRIGDVLPILCLVLMISVVVIARIQILYLAALAHRPGVG